MRKKSTVLPLTLFLFTLSEHLFAQNDFFQFKVQNQGIYKITSAEASKLGLANLSEVAIFGHPGMLPQKLDQEQLQLQEIPVLLADGNLYFFLSGPHTLTFSEDEIGYSHHLYADSLSFLIGNKENPMRITKSGADPQAADSDQIWYRFTTFKEDQTNILNSGRTWYSSPLRQGQSLTLNPRLTTETTQPWIIQGNLMARSFTATTMRIFSGTEQLKEVSFSPIPNSTYGTKGRNEVFDLRFIPTNNSLPQLRFTFQGAGSESSGHLDYVAIGVPYSTIHLTEGIFESENTASLNFPAGKEIWEVSDFYRPKVFDISSGQSASGKKWVIFSPENIPVITQFQSVSMELRDQHSSPELLIITSPYLLSSARKLQAHKERMGIQSLLATTEEIYQAFGYGNPDLTAIRNFIASIYHPEKRLKNVLILGKGTFDSKSKLGGRPNLVPIYSSRESLNPLTTFSSDDYFGLIDWGQGTWEESREGDEAMQIGVGRLPAINFAEANEMVEKIIRYETNPIRTPKSSTVTFFADDADNNIHVRDAEAHAKYLKENHPQYLINKLYLDRFEQENEVNTQRSPQAKSALKKTLDEGTLILNYIGHGNETTLTAEELFKVSDIADWGKQEQLALWVTATCEFGRHDSPFIRSAAEELLFAQNKGAVALLTTGRPVFSSVNFALNEAFIEEVFKKHGGYYQSIGEIFRNTKNQSLNGVLNRNFSLLGDPSLKLAIPDLEVKITSLVDAEDKMPIDTLKAFQEVLLTAEIIDPLTGAFQPGFTGDYQLELRDKPVTFETLGDESSTFEFEEENILVFRGQGKVESGMLEARFFVSKGINPEFGKGNLRIRAWSPESGMQAMGGILPTIGGKENPKNPDTIGPEINLTVEGKSLGPYSFPSPNLEIEADFFDQSGINTTGFVSGHELTLQLNDQEPINLNEEFLAEDGSYQRGSFRITLKGLQEGQNSITITAWDNVGNKSTLTLEIEIIGSKTIRILDHKVYPNPATTESNFEIKHNRPDENLNLTLEVYTLYGQILFSETFRFVGAEGKLTDLRWIFLQNQTKYPAKGTYIYKLEIQSESDSSSDSISGKIVIR